jgi:hypothetical protein
MDVCKSVLVMSNELHFELVLLIMTLLKLWDSSSNLVLY